MARLNYPEQFLIFGNAYKDVVVKIHVYEPEHYASDPALCDTVEMNEGITVLNPKHVLEKKSKGLAAVYELEIDLDKFAEYQQLWKDTYMHDDDNPPEN